MISVLKRIRCVLGIHKWDLWYSKAEIVVDKGKSLDYREEHKICRYCGRQVINVWQEKPNKWKLTYGNLQDRPREPRK